MLLTTGIASADTLESLRFHKSSPDWERKAIVRTVPLKRFLIFRYSWAGEGSAEVCEWH